MFDRTDPEGAIAEAARKYSNWGRWGADDVLGTVNHIDGAKRREGAALVRLGVSFSLSQRFGMDGPQKGWRRRTNPVHTMLDTGTDAALGNQGFPHGFGGADDVVAMPLQCSTQWDGLGHIFDHGRAWNDRPAEEVVTSEGDLVTGIEHMAAPVAGRAPGSGITLQGNALRVLHELGVREEVEKAGFAFDSLGMRAPDGSLLAEIPDARTGGPDLPATLGMNRPELSAILTGATRRAGVRLRLGLTAESLTDTPDGVDVVLSDGTTGRYDLVVGADGIRSTVRRMLGVATEPEPTGMGIWRIHTRRPDSVRRTDLVYGGPCYIAGYCPTGPDTMYAYLVERARAHVSFTAAESAAHMSALSEGYGGVWDEIRADIAGSGRVNYTWFESLLVDRPWNRGRTVLIGDAAHACPPTLAQGAAQGLEDASVLAELLLAADHLDQGLFDAFTDRRHDRARAVVEASVTLARWQLDGTRDTDVPGLMHRISTLVTELP